jgi:hypothetical protein
MHRKKQQSDIHIGAGVRWLIYFFPSSSRIGWIKQKEGFLTKYASAGRTADARKPIAPINDIAEE